MKTTLEFIKLTLVTVGGTLAIMFALGIASVPALAENKISTKDHWQSYHGETKAGTGEKGYSKDYEHKIEGKYSEKFVLGHGDCGYDQGWNDCITDRGRIERYSKASFSRHKWYKFSIYVGEKWDQDTTASIAQVKTKGVRYPVWMLRIDNGWLKWETNMIDCRVPYIMPVQDLKGKWNEIVLYVNYSKKTSKWLPEEYASIWINGKRQDISKCSWRPLMGKFHSSFNVEGASFRYGLYHSYVSRELYQKAIMAGVEMNLKGWNDKHSNSTARSRTNDPWSIDWPVKLETKRIWFDDMHEKASKKILWDLEINTN